MDSELEHFQRRLRIVREEPAVVAVAPRHPRRTGPRPWWSSRVELAGRAYSGNPRGRADDFADGRPRVWLHLTPVPTGPQPTTQLPRRPVTS